MENLCHAYNGVDVEYYPLVNSKKRAARRVKSEFKGRLRKNKIFNKFNGQCAYCAVTLDISSFTIDHVFPKSLGGSGLLSNLYPSCRDCNTKKGNLVLDVFRRKIKEESENVDNKLNIFHYEKYQPI